MCVCVCVCGWVEGGMEERRHEGGRARATPIRQRNGGREREHTEARDNNSVPATVRCPTPPSQLLRASTAALQPREAARAKATRKPRKGTVKCVHEHLHLWLHQGWVPRRIMCGPTRPTAAHFFPLPSLSVFSQRQGHQLGHSLPPRLSTHATHHCSTEKRTGRARTCSW